MNGVRPSSSPSVRQSTDRAPTEVTTTEVATDGAAHPRSSVAFRDGSVVVSGGGGGDNGSDFDVDLDYFGAGGGGGEGGDNGNGSVEAKLDQLTSQLADVTAALKALTEGGGSGVLSPATSQLSEAEMSGASSQQPVEGAEEATGAADGGHGGGPKESDGALHRQVTGAIHRQAAKMRKSMSSGRGKGSTVKDSEDRASAHPQGER